MVLRRRRGFFCGADFLRERRRKIGEGKRRRRIEARRRATIHCLRAAASRTRCLRVSSGRLRYFLFHFNVPLSLYCKLQKTLDDGVSTLVCLCICTAALTSNSFPSLLYASALARLSVGRSPRLRVGVSPRLRVGVYARLRVGVSPRVRVGTSPPLRVGVSLRHRVCRSPSLCFLSLRPLVSTGNSTL